MRIGVGLLAVLVGLVVLSAAFDAFVPSQHGPTSSSYATTPGGLAAYAELLARAGHPVSQLRRAPAPGVLDPRDTVVLLDPDLLLPTEGRAVRAFVAAGGRLVAGGSSDDAFLATILPRPPTLLDYGPPSAQPLGPAETAGVRRVDTLGQGGWSDATPPAGMTAVLGRPDAPSLLLAGTLGRGRIALLADASPLQNRLLASADDARLGVDLAGPAGRPVVFVESVHGYGVQRGLAALPGRWKWMFAGLTLAAVAWVVGRWRRLGPPSVRGRRLPPARSAYLHGMTNILRRADRPIEVAGLARVSARRLLARRTGLSSAAGPEEHRAAAVRLGLTEREARLTVDDGPLSADDLLVVAAALARLQPGPRRHPGADLAPAAALDSAGVHPGDSSP